MSENQKPKKVLIFEAANRDREDPRGTYTKVAAFQEDADDAPVTGFIEIYKGGKKQLRHDGILFPGEKDGKTWLNLSVNVGDRENKDYVQVATIWPSDGSKGPFLGIDLLAVEDAKQAQAIYKKDGAEAANAFRKEKVQKLTATVWEGAENLGLKPMKRKAKASAGPRMGG